MVAFGFVPSFFFAGSTQPYCYLDFYRPQGVKITHTSEDLHDIEQFVLKQDHVVAVSTFVGQSPLRYMLPLDVKDPNGAYGQLLIKTDDYRSLDGLMEKLGRYIRENYPDSESNIMKFQNGPPLAYRIELQFRGPDKKVLRELADKAKTIMRRFPTKDVRDDWRNRVSVLRPEISETAARKAGITRDAVAKILQMNFGGMPVGYFREEEDLIPMIVRAPESLHDDYTDARKIQIWSPVAGRSIPLEQVVRNWDNTKWEDGLIKRRYRMREIEAQCNQKSGLASTLLAQMMPVMEEELLDDLPPGYTYEWDGEYKSSNEGKEPLAIMFPICMFAMFVTLICLFNSVRIPVVIFLCLPLIIIGVAFGLLLSGIPFGFMSILGFLGLSGMLIKNAIVLIDEIELDRRKGEPPYQAVLDAAVSRVRPVVMASGTTVLGMLPLLWDPFFNGMGATVASGLIGSTALVLLVLPLFYILIFRIKPDKKYL